MEENLVSCTPQPTQRPFGWKFDQSHDHSVPGRVLGLVLASRSGGSDGQIGSSHDHNSVQRQDKAQVTETRITQTARTGSCPVLSKAIGYLFRHVDEFGAGSQGQCDIEWKAAWRRQRCSATTTTCSFRNPPRCTGKRREGLIIKPFCTRRKRRVLTVLGRSISAS